MWKYWNLIWYHPSQFKMLKLASVNVLKGTNLITEVSRHLLFLTSFRIKEMVLHGFYESTTTRKKLPDTFILLSDTPVRDYSIGIVQNTACFWIQYLPVVDNDIASNSLEILN